MEGIPNNFENREEEIDSLIEDLAERTEMDPDEIISDMVSFMEIAEGDVDALPYFESLMKTYEELGGETSVSIEELLVYTKQKKEEMLGGDE